MDLVFSRTKKIPNNKFGRECSLCSSRHGVPIECSARGCKAAYHTTCAIRGKLKMQAIFGKNYKGGIKLRSYCKDHSPSANLDNELSDQSDAIDANGVKEIDMTNLADDQTQESNYELDYFWKYVDINEVHKQISEAYTRRSRLRFGESQQGSGVKESSPKKKNVTSLAKNEHKKQETLSKKTKIKSEKASTTTSDEMKISRDIDPLVIDLIYRYWMLLRTANNGQSLIKFSPSALKEREFEQRKSIMRLRIELERVRNLSYMIGKREKLKLSWLRTHQNIIKRTFSIIDELNPIVETRQMIEPPSNINNNCNSNSNPRHNHIAASNHNHQSNNNHQQSCHNQPSFNSHVMNNKKPSQQYQHLQPTNGMFDERDQLIGDLLTCDQIYEPAHGSTHTNSNLNNLSYQERCTLEGRRTLSLVRRINRQLKNMPHEPAANPYAKNYIVPKRSDSPVGATSTLNTATTTNNHHHSHHHQNHHHHQSHPNSKVIKYR